MERLARRGPAVPRSIVDVGIGLLAFVVATRVSLTVEERHDIPSFVVPLAILLGAAALVEAVQDGRPWPWRTAAGDLDRGFLLATAAVGGYLLALLVSVLVAGDRTASLDSIEGWTKEMLVLAAVLLAVDGPRRLRSAAWGLTAGLALLVVPSVVQAASGTWTNEQAGLAVPNRGFVDGTLQWRAGGPMGSANHYAQWVVVLLPVAIERAMAKGPAVARLAAGLTAVVAVVAVLVSQSRSGLLALVTAGAVIGGVLAWRGGGQRLGVAIGLAAAVLLLLLGPGRVERQVDRFDDVTDLVTRDVEDSYSSESGRVSAFWAGVHMWLDNPLLGVGAGNFEREYPPYADDLDIDTSGDVKAPHAVLTEVGAETGTVGLVAFGFLLAVAGYVSTRAVRDLRASDDPTVAWTVRALQLAGCAWLVTSLFLNLSHPQVPLFVLGLLLVSGRVAGAVPRRIDEPGRVPASWR